MHYSRLAGFIIDSKDTPPDTAAAFWGQALGMKSKGDEGNGYAELESEPSRDLHLEVQNVEHESRLHLDLHTDDVPAEVARLETLGARQVLVKERWTVMEAPTGHRFCVVKARVPMVNLPGVNRWP